VLGEGAEADAPVVPIIEVWNKWDQLDPVRRDELEAIRAIRPDEVIVPVSALTGQGCETLLDTLGEMLTADASTYSFILPAGDGQKLAWLHAHGEVLADSDAGEIGQGPQRRIEVRLSPREFGRFSRL
jgi:GTP-binding protein HflX